MAITRLWWFTLQPAVSSTDPAFTSLWADVLELCATYTPSPGPSSSHGHVATLSQPCPRRPHHFLFQSISPSPSSTHPTAVGGADGEDGREDPVFVLISTYPSLAICAQADAAYNRSLRPRVLERVRHRALRQFDMEDGEVVPALLSGRPRRKRSSGGRRGGRVSISNGSAGGAEDGRRDDDDEDDEGSEDQSAVTVIISSHDPLRSEVAESLSGGPSGRRMPVPPPNEEISGADVYEVPPAPTGGRGGEAGEEDVFAGQRGEEKKWVRISRRPEAGGDDGDIEVFRLRELLAR